MLEPKDSDRWTFDDVHLRKTLAILASGERPEEIRLLDMTPIRRIMAGSLESVLEYEPWSPTG